MLYHEIVDKYPAFAGYSSSERHKYYLFSVIPDNFDKIFNPTLEIKPEDAITFFKKGKATMENVHGNKIVKPEKAKYLVFPINTKTKNMRSNFSVFKSSYSYIFSIAWLEYLPLILEGKLIPISYDNYVIKRNFVLTRENIKSLCDMIISEDQKNKKLAWNIIYSIDLEKSERGLIQFIILLMKAYAISPDRESPDIVYYNRYFNTYISRVNAIPADLYNTYLIPHIEKEMKNLLDIYHPHAIFEEIKLKKYEHHTNINF